jgi:cell pole-organizing protein PopZ
MDNLQFWIWLIVIVVTFLARGKKKKTGEQPTSFDDRPTGQQPTQKPVSFEDLLREIQATKAPQPQRPQQLPPKKEEYVDYDDEIEEEVVVEKVDYRQRDRDTTFETYERAKQAAFNRPSLEETMKVEDTIVKFGQFKGYEQENQVVPALTYVKDLQDPEGFKKAFILSEILNRKF